VWGWVAEWLRSLSCVNKPIATIPTLSVKMSTHPSTLYTNFQRSVRYIGNVDDKRINQNLQIKDPNIQRLKETDKDK